MKKILVTGGPVHAHLDAVKIITNEFRGGRMEALAREISSIARISAPWPETSMQVHYLCQNCIDESLLKDCGVKVIRHNGYNDYRDKILAMAPEMDAIILGAAVVNLIPEKPWEGKFPSHNYREGETINIPFIIAPRVINMVKAVAKPTCHLFGFKLLKGVPHEELIDAAYEIVMGAKATCVFANDRNDLDTKYAVTKERGVQVLTSQTSLSRFIMDRINDEYYTTTVSDYYIPPLHWLDEAKAFAFRNKDKFVKIGEHMFGTVALRIPDSYSGAFITTGRGKKELDSWSYVNHVNHIDRVVQASSKATLNAPLLDIIFRNNPDVKAILHYHKTGTDLPKLPYAPPGTIADSIRDVHESFEIEGHGVFELYRNVGAYDENNTIRDT